MREAFIVSAVRTQLGGFNGFLVGIGTMDLGAIAIEEAIKRPGVKKSEVNEAFFGFTLEVMKELTLSADKSNVNGGSVALSHPIGASGCRVLVTLLYEWL